MLTAKRKTDIDKCELSNEHYSDRLKNLNLPTLKYRPYQGDMIEQFKISKRMYDPTCVLHFDFIEL